MQNTMGGFGANVRIHFLLSLVCARILRSLRACSLNIEIACSIYISSCDDEAVCRYYTISTSPYNIYTCKRKAINNILEYTRIGDRFA